MSSAADVGLPPCYVYRGLLASVVEVTLSFSMSSSLTPDALAQAIEAATEASGRTFLSARDAHGGYISKLVVMDDNEPTDAPAEDPDDA